MPKTEKPAKDNTFDQDAAVAFYRDNSKIQENGIRHIEKAAITGRLKDVHGLDIDVIEKFHNAMVDERSAIATLTGHDLKDAIEAAKKSDATAEAVNSTTATTSFWRHDGMEALTVIGLDETGDTTIDDGGNVVPVTKHGRIRTSITAHDGIRKKTVNDVAKTISALFD